MSATCGEEVLQIANRLERDALKCIRNRSMRVQPQDLLALTRAVLDGDVEAVQRQRSLVQALTGKQP